MRKSLPALAAAGALSLGLTGCYGTFPLVRKTYAFNKQVSSNKFVQEAVFLAMNIIPVYGLAGVGDALILNTVEFWTGSNPMAGTTHTETENGAVAASKVLPDGRLELTVTDAEGRTATTILERESDGVSARTPEGELLGKVAMTERGAALVGPRD
ncbi:MAG: DUF3332 family protein [Fibrobacteria bacterium]|nr:DUF3332 family protein [Fibrobacteria bacterium]